MSAKTRSPLLVLAGPTGAGKSALGLRLAAQYDAEIVNGDAFQIYRGMEIGTAQPSWEERSLVPHHLYGFLDPGERMSAAAYAALADRAISDILGRGKRALVVGGSGFYLRALLWGLFEAPLPDMKLRAELSARAAREGGKEALYEELRRVDPEAAARIPVGDVYRVSRALEVFYQTGIPLTEHHRAHTRSLRYEATILVLSPEREVLIRRQEERVLAMFAAGWEEEVRRLLAAGISREAPGFRALGYRDVAALVMGERTREEVIASILREHKRYAKRQRTWMRGEAGSQMFSSAEDPALEAAVRGSVWGSRG